MPLTAEKRKKLHAAILSGFSGSDLEQLLLFELNERLDNLVSPGALNEVVVRLIDWAEKTGRVEELARALQRARPSNREVQTAVSGLLAPAEGGAEQPIGTAPLDGSRRARLRAVLLDQFPTRTAIAMLVDDSLSVNLNQISAGTNLTETVFELIQWASVDPKRHLRPLLAKALEERPNSTELNALQSELFGG
jgi:hypothetical protein